MNAIRIGETHSSPFANISGMIRAFLLMVLLAGNAQAVTDTFATAGAATWVAPAGVTSVTVEAWGGGGGGGAATGSPAKGGGGAGGQYAKKVLTVVPGASYAIAVGAGGLGGVNVAGGMGGDSTFAATSVVAKGGAGGGVAITNNSCAAAGVGAATGGVGDPGFVFAGGSGSACAVITTPAGGAGGGGAGSTGAGGNAVGNTAGTGTTLGGGAGGAGLTARGAGNPGSVSGGGGGAGYATSATNRNGGAGAAGKVTVTYVPAPVLVSINTASANPTTAASVSWTVTFNVSVSGLSSTNFTLVNSGLGGAPAITAITGSGAVWTVTASTGTGTGTLGLNMSSVTGLTPAITNAMPFVGQIYSVRPIAPKTYYHDTTTGVAIGFDGSTNVVSGTNVVIPPIITASLTTANTCAGNARSASHPIGWYTHSRWYLNANYATATSVGANPSGNAVLRGGAATDTVIVRLYDYDPVTGGKTLIGSSATITLTTFGATTDYPYTISSPLYTVPAGHRLMLQYDFNQPLATYNARVYCLNPNTNILGYLTVTETPAPLTVDAATSTVEASPTSVEANNASVATITVTLKTSSGLPVPDRTVTLAADSGNSTIATLNGITDANGVARFTVKDGTVEGPITYTATDTSDSLVITQTAQVTFTAVSLCFTDDFNRAALLSTSNWTRTSGSIPAFNAEIVNNRLRLTDATTNRATAVHLQRLFPGAGNKVVAEFDYFSYNGTGADGVVMTLSDAAVSPAAGAFGGSLGYAQKSNPGSDCTVAGGCPGFAGGWIGIGLDEYGNYSNPTEGRVGGPGARPDTVAIRGSGSAQSGYNYHTGVSAPGLDNGASTTPAPGHRYRITVDHSDGIHAYVSVDRDTTGTGNSYVNLIPVYDAKAIPTQAAVPANWYFSFTGSTGASASIHEIDNMTVCNAQPLLPPALDHVRIMHDGSALTCVPEAITLKACANPECSALYTGSVTVTLPVIGGATWSANPVTFSNGQTAVTLAKTAAGGVTLSGTVTAPSSMAAVCYNGATSGDCALTYASNACAFDAVEPGKLPSTPIYTKLAGTAFSVDVLALTAGAINTAYTGTVTVDMVDQTGVAAGACGTTALTLSTNYTFIAANAGRKTFSFNYPNAAKDVRVRIRSGATTACSSDNFAIRPASFSVTSPDATNTGSSGVPIIKAGATFGLDASSATNYTGTALVNNAHIEAHGGAVQTGTLGGSFSPAAAPNWISKGTAFTYSEVGSFRFAPWGIYDDGSFVAVDREKPTPECFIDTKVGTAAVPADPNVIDGNGKYGCYFGGAVNSPYFGRFVPDHFETDVTGAMLCPATAANPNPLACPASLTMAYSGQAFFVDVFAKNAGGATTQNYEGAYARNVTLTAWDAPGGAVQNPGGGALGNNAVAAATFAAGVATVATPTYTFAAGTVPTDVHIRATEAVGGDGVTSLRVASVEGGGKVVSGRIKLSNAHGSELLRLPLTATVQYFNGTFWVTSATDSVTSLTLAATYNLLNKSGAITGTTTPTPAGAATVTNGILSISLSKPTGGAVGSATIAPTVPAYLPLIGGRATFGVYKGNNEFIYLRENY